MQSLMLTSADILQIVRHEGLTFDQYTDKWRLHDAQSMKGLERMERLYRFYTRYNLERQEAVFADFEPPGALLDAAGTIEEDQTWLFITEDWCADAAYSLPIVLAAVDSNPRLSLRILERDSYPEVIDRYLTHGGRSIPILIAFNDSGDDHRLWGPKPHALDVVRREWQEAGVEGRLIASQTIEWYDGGGWKSIEPELTSALHAMTAAAIWK